MSEPTVVKTRIGGVLRLALNRPDKLNAFTRAMHTELRAALEAGAADATCRVIVLTGVGRAFCAGQDLSDTQRGKQTDTPDAA
ncbi:MAG: enoyl-CoA hydratase-related protein, partial [Hyphomicrobiaceae bacterium]